MAEIMWSVKAENDLKMINDCISADSEYYAEKVIERLYDRTKVLKEHPEIGKVVREFSDSSIRELIEPPCRIIYKVQNADAVVIVRIYHSARLLKIL